MTLMARAIVHRFVRGGDALCGVDAAFVRGRVTAILGPNGAGKTTLLRCLIGAVRPTSGTALLDGRPLAGHATSARVQAIAYVDQRPLFSAGLTVREVVELGRFAIAPAPARIDAALAANDLASDGERIVTHLSVGQQQRVALARAMAQVAADGWLILDEPLAALDPAHQRRVVGLLRSHARGGGGVVATVHDVPSALAVADDAVLLRDGRIAAAGAVHTVLEPATLERVFDAPFERFGATVMVALPKGGEPATSDRQPRTSNHPPPDTIHA